MKRQTTYNELVVIRNDIHKNASTSPSYAFFFQEKIKNFFQRNAINLKLADERMKRLIAEHVETETVNGKDEPIYITGENGEKDFKYLDDAHKEEFSKAYSEFMQRGITIEC